MHKQLINQIGFALLIAAVGMLATLKAYVMYLPKTLYYAISLTMPGIYHNFGVGYIIMFIYMVGWLSFGFLASNLLAATIRKLGTKKSKHYIVNPH